MEYPLMLYRPGSEIEVDGTGLDTFIVDDEDAHKAAEADGWAVFADISAAKAANDAEDASDESKPRRGRPPKAG